MTENERIRKLRLALGLNQQEFGARIGIKVSAVSYLESGKSRLTESNLILICEKFHVNRSWLLDGEGDMFLPESGSALDVLASQYDMTPLERDMVENYLRLSRAQREVFWELLHKIVGAPAAQSGSAGGPSSSGAAISGELGQPPGSTESVREAEAAYEKALGFAPSAGGTASSTIDDTASTG